MVGSRRQGWALLRRDVGRCSSPASASPTAPSSMARRPSSEAGIELDGRATAPPAATSRARSSASGSLPARVGGGDDRASNGSVNSVHDSYTGIGGAVPLVEHDDRRGDLRRGRLGPLRDAALRPAGRLHRRPDGRPHARVPRARRSRRARSSWSMIGIAGHPAAGARRLTALAIATDVRRALDLQPRARRGSRRRSTPTPRRATTTARPSPATPASFSPTRPATPAPSGSRFADLLGRARHAPRPLRAADRRARGRRLARRQAGRAGRARAPSAPTPRPSSCS